MKLEFDGHIKTGTFSMVDRVPEGRKPVSLKWCFTYKTERKGKSRNSKQGWSLEVSRRSVT